jgi:hypothetical protein
VALDERALHAGVGAGAGVRDPGRTLANARVLLGDGLPLPAANRCHSVPVKRGA